MLSGLTADQLEAILIHELMHIRRHDYLVNIIQSCIEALMFFNPFAWMISSIIRNEREHCCDDEAVRHGNPLVYAHALATLEEYRLTKNDIALSLAQNKNQLLKRIKRIMERSAQHYSIRERMVPLLLLVIGLVCASWLSIKTAKGGDDQRHEETAADTTPKSKSKSRSATYSRKTVVTLDENGNPKTDVVESFDGDEELREAVGGFSWSIGEPVLPVEPMGPVEELAGFDMAGQFEMMPPVPEFDEHFDFAFEGFDTLPGVHFNGHDWEAFSEEFQAKFKDKFGDFYKKHGEEMAKMMAEMGAEFNMTFHEGDAETTNLRRHSDHEYDKSMAVMTEAAEQYERAAQEAMRQHEGAMEQHQRMAEQLARQTETQVKELERQTKIMEEKVKAFETEMMKQLANDGYMKKGDKLETLNWRGDHGIEVNGKMIRKSDVKKYQAIHDRFFGHRDEIRYVE